MKILFIATRILLFISFFLPFFIKCGPSAEEIMAKESAIEDSIRLRDSLSKFCLQSEIREKGVSYNSITKGIEQTNENKQTFTDRLSSFHSFLMYPTRNSISGYGIAIISIKEFEFNRPNFIGLLISLSFIMALINIFMLWLRQDHILQKITSLICFVSLTTIFLFHACNSCIDLFLWGFWLCLFLSLTNLIIAIRKLFSRMFNTN